MTPRGYSAIIPAPGRSAALPRKLLRRLGGRPLLAYAIATAQSSGLEGAPTVVTDDEEVALTAERAGCYSRLVGALSEDRLELDLTHVSPEHLAAGTGVVLLRPSAPLLPADQVHSAIAQLEANGALAAVAVGAHEMRHFEVLARTSVPDAIAEHAAFVVSRSPDALGRVRGLGDIEVLSLPHDQGIHITTQHDWWVCERLLARRRVVFVVAGHARIGMGHVYRAMGIAHDLTDHEVLFLCTRDSDLAVTQIATGNYPTVVQHGPSLLEDVLALRPDVVINDILDTDASYVSGLKDAGVRVVNFEDLGPGSLHADVVLNALYEPAEAPANYRCGVDYFDLRAEFLEAQPMAFREPVGELLVTFGGVDEANLTCRVVAAVGPVLERFGTRATVVCGPGFAHRAELDALLATLPCGGERVSVAASTRRISEYMARADLAFSSAGRTVFELSAMRVPAIIIAANRREEFHVFASRHPGLRYLGRADQVPDAALREAFATLAGDPGARRRMWDEHARLDLRAGQRRVLSAINDVIGSV